MNWFVLCFTLLCLAYAAALLHEHGRLRPLVAATLGICRRRARGEALVLLLLVFWAVKVGGSKPDPGAPQGGQQQTQAPTSGVVATNTVQEQQGADQAGAATNSSSGASSSNVVVVSSNSTPVVSSSNEVFVATNAASSVSSSNQVASATNTSSEVASSNVVAVASNSASVVSSSNEVAVATNSESSVSSSNQVAFATNTLSEVASSNVVAVSSNTTPVVSSSNEVVVVTNAAPVVQVPDQDVGFLRDRSPAQLRGMEANTAVWQSYAGPVWPFDDFTSNAIAGMAATEHPPIPDAMLASGLALYRVTTNTSLMAADSNCVPIRAWLRHGADNRGVSVDTPFPVTVGTGTYNRIGILANGRLAFGYATYQRQPTGDLPFATSYPVVTVAPFWGPFSLVPSAGSVAWTRTDSTNRFVVCWENLLQDGDAARPTSVQCEIRRDGSVRFVYGALAEGSAAASTVGVQNMGEGWSYSHGHTNRVMEGMTVTLRPVGVDGWAEADPDGDGLSNFDEFMLGTDPLLADTDGDGPSDYWEITHGYDPLVPQLGQPEPDSDGDLVPDRWENWIWLSTDAYNPESGPECFADPDQDGFVSWYEWYVLGSNDASASDPGAPDADHTDVIANIVSSRPCVLRLEGDGHVIEIPWMPGLSPAQIRLRLARGQQYQATLSRVPSSTSFPSDGFWWSNLSFSPAPGLDDLGLPSTTTGGIVSFYVGSVAVQAPDRGGDVWAVPGQAAAATNNLAAWRIEIVPPDPFCACSTSNELYLTVGSLVGGPVEWSGLPPGVVRTGNPLVFDPSKLTPGHYTVTAWAASNHLVSAQTEVDICHVGFAQSNVWLSADDYSRYDIALSGDTYVLNDISVWSEPVGICDLSFVPAGLEPGVYTVHAWDGMCGEAQMTVNVVRVDITFADPDDSSWPVLGEPKVILCDKDTRIKLKVTPQQPDLQTIFTGLGTALKIKTSGTAPNGQDYTLTPQNTTLVQGSDYSEMRVSLTRDQLKASGNLPSQENDNVFEKAWLDRGLSDPTAIDNLLDGQAFDSNMIGASRGQSTRYGTLDSTPPNSPLDRTFFISAGREIISALYGAATSPRRQIMNQADVFYYSGHGHHSDGTVFASIGPSAVTGYWNKDLDVVVIAGCAIFDINDYNNYYTNATEHAKSPGKNWEATGPAILLGYNYLAPNDLQNSDAIATSWCNNRASSGDINAWRDANDNSNGHNACAIQTGVAYYYFKKTLGFYYSWTRVPKAEW